jgi:hypothetical protein
VRKCCFQTSSIESKTFHLGVVLVGSGGRKREGAQEKTIAAWSEPSESGKEILENEKRNWSDQAALRFQRTRSRTVSFWLCSPACVATWGREEGEAAVLHPFLNRFGPGAWWCVVERPQRTVGVEVAHQEHRGEVGDVQREEVGQIGRVVHHMMVEVDEDERLIAHHKGEDL